MKLQHKLALYNSITKIAIIAILGSLILIFMDQISLNHLQQRLMDKRNKFVSNLSDIEIEDLLNRGTTFTDYNILKEEYIILTEIAPAININTDPEFTKEEREIDGDQEEYLIISNYFSYNGRSYRLEIGETMQAVQQLEKTILFFTLLILFVSIGLSIIVDLAFTRFLLAPFYRIIDQKLNKVNDPIHFIYNSVKTTTDDFKLLDNSINTLMEKISAQIIIEKQFITNVSHELLTPISILRTRLENMMNDDGLSVESQTKIVASLKTLNRLKGIINSLLLISKVENNQYHKNDLVSVQALITDIREELEDRLLARNITFENNLKQHFQLTANHSLLHILCINLINNAIKYNKENGSISISDELNSTEYRLYISDKGVGMDPEQIDKAFTRFEKLANADHDSYGLGLAIVKSIASFHQIHITIDSQKHEGTTVALIFKTEKNISSETLPTQ